MQYYACIPHALEKLGGVSHVRPSDKLSLRSSAMLTCLGQ